MNDTTNSTENLLHLPSGNDGSNDKNGITFQLLAKKVTGKQLSFKDCYLMVNAAIRHVSRIN